MEIILTSVAFVLFYVIGIIAGSRAERRKWETKRWMMEQDKDDKTT